MLGLLPIAACAHQPAAVEIAGLEQFQAPCPDEPPALSEAEALALAAAAEAALALPTLPERAQALNTGVLEPMMQRDQKLRACALYERRGRLGLLALGGRFNQAVRER